MKRMMLVMGAATMLVSAGCNLGSGGLGRIALIAAEGLQTAHAVGINLLNLAGLTT